ncbi:hypothetical protein [Mycolicibacterium helvum]|uniref:DUF2613 domain-containing protein n=1 Tax=Mycolicibacterium helvum TaxID=1534349 RepID=A0A7I7TD72_9MYCO|nr:hypothetical protein [Mycolicibacterium helvum]BBY67192.1 hypothetical protein MHEL_54350 [Mycolicibacterium helvum]
MNTTTTLTGIKKLAVYGVLLGGLGAAALGVGSGLAQANAALGSASTVQIAAQAGPSRQDGDQEVIHRGTVIPVHGDDSTHTAQHGK